MKKSDNEFFEYLEYKEEITRILPLYTKPFKDEIFTSWLLRCSSKYQLKPHTFSRYIWGETAIWNRDIDKSIKHESLEKFCSINNTNFEDGYRTTLQSFEGILFDRLNINGHSNFINSVGVFHRKRKRYALMFCPNCLKSNPYYRVTWRLSLIVSCLDCKLYLHDRCLNCKEPVMPFRLNIGEKGSYNNIDLNFCWKCNFDLSSANSKRADHSIITFTSIIHEFLREPTIESKTYLNRLVFLKRVLVSNRKLAKYLKTKRICSIKILKKPNRNPEFEILDVKCRIEIIKGMNYFLSDWPNNFKLFISNTNINYSEIVSERMHKHLYPKELLNFLAPKSKI